MFLTSLASIVKLTINHESRIRQLERNRFASQTLSHDYSINVQTEHYGKLRWVVLTPGPSPQSVYSEPSRDGCGGSSESMMDLHSLASHEDIDWHHFEQHVSGLDDNCFSNLPQSYTQSSMDVAHHFYGNSDLNDFYGTLTPPYDSPQSRDQSIATEDTSEGFGTLTQYHPYYAWALDTSDVEHLHPHRADSCQPPDLGDPTLKASCAPVLKVEMFGPGYTQQPQRSSHSVSTPPEQYYSATTPGLQTSLDVYDPYPQRSARSQEELHFRAMADSDDERASQQIMSEHRQSVRSCIPPTDPLDATFSSSPLESTSSHGHLSRPAVTSPNQTQRPIAQHIKKGTGKVGLKVLKGRYGNMLCSSPSNDLFDDMSSGSALPLKLFPSLSVHTPLRRRKHVAVASPISEERAIEETIVEKFARAPVNVPIADSSIVNATTDDGSFGPITSDEDDGQFLVEEVLDRRSKLMADGCEHFEYLIKFVGYSAKYNEWIQADDLCADLRIKFNIEHAGLDFEGQNTLEKVSVDPEEDLLAAIERCGDPGIRIGSVALGEPDWDEMDLESTQRLAESAADGDMQMEDESAGEGTNKISRGKPQKSRKACKSDKQVKPSKPATNRGSFSAMERAVIQRRANQICRERGITAYEFKEAIQVKRYKAKSDVSEIWQSLISALPLRSRVSVQKYCRRQFNNAQRGANWTAEQDAILLEYVTEYNNSCGSSKNIPYAIIAERLQRRAEDCRDRYRDYLEYPDRRTDPWTAEEEARLLDVVENVIQFDIDYIKESGTWDASRYPREALERRINWDVVAKTMKTRNRLQCHPHWYTLKNGNTPRQRREKAKARKPAAERAEAESAAETDVASLNKHNRLSQATTLPPTDQSSPDAISAIGQPRHVRRKSSLEL
ncbi:hypothetical protein EJ05DRAFT_504737 [Pseudovirgaria hyperparasitica]|uniref:Myb-like domain-containing protein n=1 Tax=Pseudovirgaria hyperparasitica TaxID=470096 RepID=A0A6A6VSS8_9PEZI|nr:uncharacterized protein EJ05DRAFT_504737 [Pseudovirgaria hyperparasitica]KAF2753642.1 hypothetical protein EJ05DRAFT_504737 [Pseudovirgaria hyperparasitica]